MTFIVSDLGKLEHDTAHVGAFKSSGVGVGAGSLMQIGNSSPEGRQLFPEVAPFSPYP